MKFKNSNGIIKEHSPLKDRLLQLGFDEHMLIKDKNLIKQSLHPQQGILDAFKNIRNKRHFLNEPGYTHFSKNHRKINPVFVKTYDIMRPGDWIAFTPTVLDEKETSLFLKMDLISRLARIFTKLVRVFTRRENLPQFTTLILSNNRQKFNTSQSYFYKGTEYVKELNDNVLFLATSESESLPDEDLFMLSSNVLANINYVYIADVKQTSKLG